MNLYSLTPLDLGIAAALVIALGILQLALGLGVTRSLYWAATRMVLQLLLVGLVLELLFEHANLYWVLVMMGVMVLLAGHEVAARQGRRFRGVWGYGIGLASLSMTALFVTLLALWTMVGVEPWYAPQYAVPLLGMILGNAMSGVAVGLNHLTQTAWRERVTLEARLMLGQTRPEATVDLRRESIRAGMIPTINVLAAAGIISLPGMMTGQILAGTPPIEAVKYQILIMFLIAAATGFGTLIAIELGTRRLFDERERLRLERLRTQSGR
ncbi:MAG: ABC transporter permease [Halothiobacillaceae bacterium]